MKLLTINGNIKANKSVSKGYMTAFLHLAPSDLSGVINTCPMASKGCRAACLNVSGMGKAHRVQNARIEKTKLFVTHKIDFLAQLYKEIANFEKLCIKKEIKPAVRLNATSDIKWEDIKVLDGKNMMQCFPKIKFYDYTKIPGRRNLPSNYHLTFSLSETNLKHAVEEYSNYRNIAVVFKSDTEITKFPPTADFLKIQLASGLTINNKVKIIDGDEHDLRFLDEQNVIIGLRAKNKAKKDETNFANKI